MSTKSAVVNTIGITFVAIGSVFVAYEVVQRFKGERYETTTQAVVKTEGPFGQPLGQPFGGKFVGVSSTKASDSAEYKSWEKRRNLVMSLGLSLIMLGSAFQIWATWI